MAGCIVKLRNPGQYNPHHITTQHTPDQNTTSSSILECSKVSWHVHKGEHIEVALPCTMQCGVFHGGQVPADPFVCGCCLGERDRLEGQGMRVGRMQGFTMLVTHATHGATSRRSHLQIIGSSAKTYTFRRRGQCHCLPDTFYSARSTRPRLCVPTNAQHPSHFGAAPLQPQAASS